MNNCEYYLGDDYLWWRGAGAARGDTSARPLEGSNAFLKISPHSSTADRHKLFLMYLHCQVTLIITIRKVLLTYIEYNLTLFLI